MPGIHLGKRVGSSGQSWSSYWASRTVTGLEITVDSDTQFTLNWTNNGTANYTGHKVYISTDGINYSLNKTIATVGTNTTVTGLTAGTLYYVKVAPYKNANIGNLSTADSDYTFGGVIGTIINDNFDRASLGSNYDAVTTKSSIALDGAKMIWSQTSQYTSWGDYCLWKDIISLEHWEASVIFKPSEKSANSWGMVIRLMSQNGTFKYDTAIQFFTNSGAGYVGSIAIYNNAEAILYKSADAVTITAGHSYLLRCKRVKNVFELYAKNLNDNSEVSYSYTWPISYVQTQILPNMGKIGLVMPGGLSNMNYEITNFTVTSDAIKRPKTIILGDSITVGYYSGATNTRFYELLFGSTNTIYTMIASAGDKLADVVNRKTEIISYQPKYLLISVGANDAATDHTAWQTAYEGLLDYVIAEGIVPICMYVTPRNSDDMRWCNTIIATITAARSIKKIDVFTPLKTGDYSLSGTYDSGDHLHPNATGHDVIYDTILAAAPELI